MRGNRGIIIWIIVGVLLIAIIAGFVRSQGPSKNWKPSFSDNSPRPFGSKLLFERLEDFFPVDTIYKLDKGPFDTLAYAHLQDVLLFIVADRYEPEAYKYEELLRFVDEGNEAFVAANYFSTEFLQELDLITSYYALDNKDSMDVEMEKSGERYRFANSHLGNYFSYWDEINGQVLSKRNEKEVLNIRLKYGEGYFTLSTHPLAFTNYYLLRNPEVHYIEEILASLPEKETIFWDNYYKPERPASSGDTPPRSNQSPGLWEYIKQHEALRWAFNILIFGSLAYVFLGGKRRQRLVPIIKPLRNSTLEFTETIGRLYLFERNKKTVGEKHKLVAEKKIRVFLAHIRSRYNIKTNQLDERFEKQLTGKTGMEEKEIRILVRQIKRVQSQADILPNTLVQLSNEIESFYNKNGR
ncbi:MAG: hypothetical protein MRZ79_01075 [Bacteroidia bacterium]|nr:hypothetical protein [Bacteroidia bacterium]